MGVANGCGCKKVLLLYLFFFAAASLLFVMFFVLVPVLFSIIFSSSINVYTYGQLRTSHSSHMKAAHTVLYMKKHTQTYAISCDGHQLYERGVDLEVEGVRYIEMHRGPAAYVLGPPPSRGRDLELEGGVNACHVEYVSSPETPTCEVSSNGVVEISLLPVCTGETSI